MRVHADPTPMFTDALRTYFTTDSEALAAFGAVRVAAEQVPEGWDVLAGVPLVTVHDDGGSEQWPVKRDPIIRVTVRARGLPLAKRVATYAHGHLREHQPAGVAHLRRNGSGFVTALDSDTGADMASFTMTAVVATVTT